MANVLLIAVAGLDWAGFVRRRGSGGLAALEDLRRRGVVGVWPALQSHDDPAAWACLASGQPPEANGLWRTNEAFNGGVRPVTRASWRSPPLWALLSAAGVTTASVAWPGSRPGDAWAGLHLDEDFAVPSGRTGAEWALPPHCAPPDAREDVRDIRVHPTEITAEMLKAFVPGLGAIDQSRDANLPRLALALAEAATVQAGAEWILRQGQAQALFVRQSWLGRVRATFEAAEAPFDGVVEAAWRFADGLVRYLADLAGPDWLVLVASPGWAWRPGLLLAAGPGVSPDPEPQTWDMLDLAPTVLARFGLAAPQFPGRSLDPIAPVPGTRAVPAVIVAPPPPPDAALLEAAVQAGYSPPPPAPDGWHAQGLAELSALILPREPERAGEAALAALRLDPANLLALSIRAAACVQLDEPDPLPELARALNAAAPARGWGALAQGAYHLMRNELGAATPWLTKAEADPEIETRLRIGAAWLAAERPTDAERVFKGVLAQAPENASAEIGLAVAARTRRDFLQAEQWLLRAIRHDPGRAMAHLQLAFIYAATGRPEMAERASASAVRLGVAAEAAALARSGSPASEQSG